MAKNKSLALAIHGGAGMLRPGLAAASAERPFRAILTEAIQHGWALLESGASADDVVVEVVTLLEDCPLFNAGRGSVLTAEGRVEMDAAIMCGRTLRAGAVAAVSGVRNPVVLARTILEDDRFVLLSGVGAVAYAEQAGLVIEDESYFVTENRVKELAVAQARGAVSLDHEKFGTVGAVALDLDGDLAAATSTGGLTNKAYGRIGDSPLIGSGTYANNKTCAVSCTGYGEHFIRRVVAHDLAARIAYGGGKLAAAADILVNEEMKSAGALGGLIAVDCDGNVTMPFNTNAMFRAARTTRGEDVVAIF